MFPLIALIAAQVYLIGTVIGWYWQDACDRWVAERRAAAAERSDDGGTAMHRGGMPPDGEGGSTGGPVPPVPGGIRPAAQQAGREGGVPGPGVPGVAGGRPVLRGLRDTGGLDTRSRDRAGGRRNQ